MSGLEDLRKTLEDAGLLIAVPADSENVVIPRNTWNCGKSRCERRNQKM